MLLCARFILGGLDSSSQLLGRTSHCLSAFAQPLISPRRISSHYTEAEDYLLPESDQKLHIHYSDLKCALFAHRAVFLLQFSVLELLNTGPKENLLSELALLHQDALYQFQLWLLGQKNTVKYRSLTLRSQGTFEHRSKSPI